MRTQGKLLQRGMTIIELMISMTIGLILMTAVASVLATAEGQKRTLTGLNDINQAGSYASYMLDTWIRTAGSGFTQTAAYAYGCPIHAVKSGTTILPPSSSLPAPFASISTTIRLAPVIIVPGGTTPSVSGNSSDALIVMEGADGGAEAYSKLQATPGAAALTLTNTQGYSGNDLLLLVDQINGSAMRTCVVEQVTTGYSGSSDTSLPLSGSYHAGDASLTSVTSSAVVTHLGNVASNRSPRFMVIGVGDNNVLYAYDLLQTGSAPLTAIAEGVFEMHALYGIDSDADGVINYWVAPSTSGTYSYSALTAGTSTAAGLLQNIKAIRIGLIMRASLKEKPDSNQKYATGTPDSFTFFSDATCSGTCTVTRTFTTTEKQYRYRKVDITVPLRNNLVL